MGGFVIGYGEFDENVVDGCNVIWEFELFLVVIKF